MSATRLAIRLLAATALAAALGGCPPVSPPTQPATQAGAAAVEPAPALGKAPGVEWLLPSGGGRQPLTGDALAKALSTRAQIAAAVRESPSSLPTIAPVDTTAPAPLPVTAPATLPADDEPPARAVKLYLQGREKFLEGAYAESMDYLEQSLRIDPHAFTVLKLMGRVCFASRQLPRGSLYLRRAAALRPDDLEVNYLLGRYWFELNGYPTALRYFLAADASPDRSAGSPESALTVYYLARTLQSAGYHLEAARQYEALLTLLAQPVPAFRYDSELAALIEGNWLLDLVTAENYYLAKRYAEAVKHYQAAAEHETGSIYIATRLVAAQGSAGQNDAALAGALKLVAASQASDESLALLVWVYKHAGREAVIRQDLTRLVAADPRNAGAAVALASVQERSSEQAAAVKTLETYLQNCPDDLAVLKRLVPLAQQSGDVGAGFTAIVRALAAKPDEVEAVRHELARLIGDRPTVPLWKQLESMPPLASRPGGPKVEGFRQYLLGVIAQACEQTENAAVHFQAAITANPSFWTARESYLSFLLNREEFAQAQQVVKEAIAAHQGGAKAYELLLDSEVAQGRYAHALELALKAKDDFPDSLELRLDVANIYRLREQNPEARAELIAARERFPQKEEVYRRLIDFGQQINDEALVFQTLERLSREIPTSHYAHVLTAQMYARAGRLVDAQMLLQRLLDEDHNDLDVLISLSQVKALQEQIPDGVKLLENALGRYKAPENPPLPLVDALADLYRYDKRPNAAVDLFARYAKADPDAEIWTLSYAGQLVQSERKNDAEQVLRDGLARHPSSQPLTMALARFMASADRAAEGATLVRGFMDRQGVTAERMYLLSHLQEEAGQHDEALRSLQKVLELMPDHTGANNDLGYFWTDRRENLAVAEGMVRKALENEPNNAAFIDSLGWVLYMQGKFKEAEAQLVRAVDLSHGEPELLAHLGDTLYRLGKRAQAVERWTEADSLKDDPGPVSPERARLKKYLAQILQQAKAGKDVEVTPTAVPATQPRRQAPTTGTQASTK